MPEWQLPHYLADHFRDQGREVGARTVEEYDASARHVIASGTIFTFEDRSTGETRVGCYERSTSLFTSLSEDDRWIVTHFRCDERYLRGLPESTYE